MNRKKNILLIVFLLLIGILIINRLAGISKLDIFYLFPYWELSRDVDRPVKTYVILQVFPTDKLKDKYPVKNAAWNEVEIFFPAVFYLGKHLDENRLYIPGIFEQVVLDDVRILNIPVEIELDPTCRIGAVGNDKCYIGKREKPSCIVYFIKYGVYEVGEGHVNVILPAISDDDIIKLIKRDSIIGLTEYIPKDSQR